MGNFGSFEIFVIIFLFVSVVFLPIFAIGDILRSKFEGNDAILMVLIVIFVPVAGSILYFSLGTARKIRP